MKKTVALFIITCFLLSSFPAFAGNQMVYVNDKYVGMGSNEMNQSLHSPVLHIPAVKTAKALGLESYLDGDVFHASANAVNYKTLDGFKSEVDGELYLPMTWFTNILGCEENWERNGECTVANFKMPTNKNEIKIFINGKRLYSATAPIIVNNRTYLPFRVLLESYGANIDYFNDIKGIKSSLNNSVLDMQIENKTYGISYANGQTLGDFYTFSREEKPFIYKNRTMVPLRLISELLGASVKWDEKTKTISISNAGNRFLAPPDAKKIDDEYYFSSVYN